MSQRRHHHQASFLLCLAVVAAALLGGCEGGATGAHGQHQAVAAAATATTPLCTGVAVDYAYTFTVAELKSLATVIVVGTVIPTEEEKYDLCHTNATVRVDRTVYDPQQQIVGTTLAVTTHGDIDVKLSAGDQVVLFLYPDDTPVTRYAVVDGVQGVTHIIDGMVQPWSAGGPMTLDAYIAHIEHA